MPSDMATRTLFILPERLTGAQFFASLTTFTLNNWYPHATIIAPWVATAVPAEYDPAGAGIKIDLQYLYVVVISLGGYETIETTQRWGIVAINMSLWPEDQDTVRETYRRYLWYYEVYSRQVRRLFVARKRKYRDPREYSVQDVVKGQCDNDREDYHVSCLPWSALDSRLECDKQGALDGTLVFRDYFSLSPAVQLSIKQQAYILALEVFTNPGEGDLAFFTPPESISPSSAASIDVEPDQNYPSDDEHLSDEVKGYKEAILAANRNYIVLTQIYMTPQPLPSSTPAELAHFMHDEVKLTLSHAVKQQVEVNPDHAEVMAKFGFTPVQKSRSCVSCSSDDDEGEPLRFSDYYGLNCIGEVDRQNCEAELTKKYGLMHREYRSMGQPKVEKKGLNFQEYIETYGLDAPEVKSFFNDRLKLEGGFWEHELERLQALERRVKGDEVASNKGWDKVSSSGFSTSTDTSSGSVSSLYPPPLFTEQRPISMHDYARKIAKQRKKPLEWGYLTSTESSPIEASVPIQRQTDLEPGFLKLSPTTIYSGQPSKGGLLADARAEYIRQHQAFARNALGYEIQHSYKPPPVVVAHTPPGGPQVAAGPYPGSPNQSNLSGEEFRIYKGKPSSNPIRQILSLPDGAQMDITDLNPLNPPSYNYTQAWLQQRVANEDTEDLEDALKQRGEDNTTWDLEEGIQQHNEENSNQALEEEIRQHNRQHRTRLRPDQSWIKTISDSDDDEPLHSSQRARISKGKLKDLNNMINRSLAALQNVEEEGDDYDDEYGYEDTYLGGVRLSL